MGGFGTYLLSIHVALLGLSSIAVAADTTVGFSNSDEHYFYPHSAFTHDYGLRHRQIDSDDGNPSVNETVPFKVDVNNVCRFWYQSCMYHNSTEVLAV